MGNVPASHVWWTEGKHWIFWKYPMFRYHPIGIVGIPPTWIEMGPSSTVACGDDGHQSLCRGCFLMAHIIQKNKTSHSKRLSETEERMKYSNKQATRRLTLKRMITTSRRDLTGMMRSLRGNYPKVAEVFRLVNYHNLPRLTITQKDVSCIPVSSNITIRWSAEELQKQELPSGVGRLGKRKWRWNPPIWVNHGQFHSISLFPS